MRPRHRIMRGLMSEICFQRYGSHASTSSGFGSRLFGGRDFRMFAIYTSSRLKSIAASILLRSCPARPTNGSPCLSSSAPGASPITMTFAFGLPTPKTNFVSVSQSWHLWQVLIFDSSFLRYFELYLVSIYLGA